MALAPAAPERLGRYRLVEKLGQGGMATVYLAEDEELKRTVALKLMHQFLSDKKEGAARFAREARAVAALRHPNVLAVYDYIAESETHPAFLVMECIRGPSLRRFLDDNGAPLPEVAAMIGWKVALALETAHQAGIVHRDVKPENVLLDEGGRVVLCDFGVARMLSADGTMTATGALIGSPAYMSPEQAEGDDELDCRSDLFSLGTMLYLLATGAMPFVAKEPLALLSKIHRGDHKPPTAVNPRVPPFLERVIERCLRVDKTTRWQSAAEVAAALEAGLRADGLGEVDRELTTYFVSPPAYNAAAEPRIVDGSLARAKTAAARGELSIALGLCNRVLAWRPDDKQAQTLLDRLGQQGSSRRWFVAVAALVVLLGGGGALGWRAWHHPPPTLVPTPLPPPTLVVAPPPVEPKIEAKIDPPQVPPHVESPAVKPRVSTGRHSKSATEKPVNPPSTPTPTPSPPPSAPAEVRPVAPPPAVVPETPKMARLIVRARPFCQEGLVDGKIKIDVGEPNAATVSAGTHHVRCKANGRTLERDVTLVAGEKAEVEFIFGDVGLVLRLKRGDQVGLDEREPTASPPRQPQGHRLVRLFKEGKQIDQAYLDMTPPTCVLVDTPHLECRKP